MKNAWNELEKNEYNVKQQLNIEIDYYDLELSLPLRLDYSKWHYHCRVKNSWKFHNWWS
jgi:hypothetical protein